MSDIDMLDATTSASASLASPQHASGATSETETPRADATTASDDTKPRGAAITAIDFAVNDDMSGSDPVAAYPQPGRPSSPLAAPPRSAVSMVSADTGRAESVDSSGQVLDLKTYTALGKKRKKKGWKGYAMVYYDSDGNPTEERYRDETPGSDKDEPPRSAATTEPLGRGSRRAAAAPPKPVKPKVDKPKKPRASVAKEPKAKKVSVVAQPVERKRVMSELTLTSEEGVSRDTPLSDGESEISSAASPPPLLPPKTRKPAAPRQSLQQAKQATQAGPSRQIKSTSPKAAKLTASTSAPLSAGNGGKSASNKQPPAKRRKVSPVDSPGPTEDSRAGSSAPSRSAPAAKGKEKATPQPPIPTERQRAAAAAKASQLAKSRQRDAQLRDVRRDVRESNNMSTPPAWVEDAYKPIRKAPRAGMGDRDDFPDFADPEESMARLETRRQYEAKMDKMVKDEGEWLVKANKEANARKELLARRLPMNGKKAVNGYPPTPPPTGARGMDLDDDSDGISPATPEPVLVPTIQVVKEDFEAEFDNMMSYYAHPPVRHYMPSSPDDPAPPTFDKKQGPTVVLASRRAHHSRDKHELAHREGYAGLPLHFDREIQGFVDNVRGNVRQLADYYFDSPGTRRNAFIERIGRELTIFGLEMTNEGDLAVQKPRATASSSAHGEK